MPHDKPFSIEEYTKAKRLLKTGKSYREDGIVSDVVTIDDLSSWIPNIYSH